MPGDLELDVVDYPKEAPRIECKGYFRVYAAPWILIATGLEKGNICNLIISGSSAGTVLVWEYEKISKKKDTLLYIPKHIQSLYDINRGSKVSLMKINDQIPRALSVTLQEVVSNESKPVLPKLHIDEFQYWAWALAGNLYNAEIIASSMVIEGVEAKAQTRSFKIVQIDDSSTLSLYRFQESCKVQVRSNEDLGEGNTNATKNKNLLIPADGIGGLEAQLKELTEAIFSFGNTESWLRIPSSIPEWKNGIILYGSRGTGKTFLLHKIAEAGWRKVFDLGAELSKYPTLSGQALAAMKNVFEDAKNSQPSMILIDELENFAAYDEFHSSVPINTFNNTLRQEMVRLGSFRTLVVATTKSLANINPSLRSIHSFYLEIEIPVPDLRSRLSILKNLSDIPIDTTDILLENIASRTHGFVAADLAMLLGVATEKARYRISARKNEELITSKIEEQDFESALQKVRPTAIREIFVEIQQTTWDDIGGQEEVKNILQQALIWPSKYSDIFQAGPIKPPKGLLLYGPPGCSKTMTARAAATESGFNFIAVKGAELLNMYVGESERKIRDIFSKARAASPSILFFDEIDAIGTSRSDGQHSGLNMVTTLLNELDGIVGLTGVFVLAATNRPEVIDPALTRSGRLDKMLYVGPPDLNARRYILSKQLQNLEVLKDVDLQVLAQETDGFSGAELINICNEAQLAAIEDLELDCSEGHQKLPGLCRKHFEKALGGVDKNITPEMLEMFHNFRMKNRAQQHTKPKRSRNQRRWMCWL